LKDPPDSQGLEAVISVLTANGELDWRRVDDITTYICQLGFALISRNTSY
ncbi:MAG: hypothetical protein JSS00_00710, partial [Proteobacteria bacterium]|nr:hypothetical protein [Pseudomonadota bacterium]